MNTVKYCTVEKCGKLNKALGLCAMHWWRRKYKGSEYWEPKGKTSCKKAGCEEVATAKGACGAHYNSERRENGYFAVDIRKPSTRYTTTKRYALKRGLDFTLSFEQFVLMIKSDCHYCGHKLNETRGPIDRMDNGIGYLPENCVPCCKICNATKSDRFTYEEFLELAKTEIYQKMIQRLHSHGLF
jgi:hypothetical protein